MSSIGIWKLEMKNPFNIQKANLYLSIKGNTVTGRMETCKNSGDITDTKIEGGILTWKLREDFHDYCLLNLLLKLMAT
jgi:hypothetical protein